MSLYIVLCLTFICNVYSILELPTWHLKPLGSHIEPDTVDEVHAGNLISPEDFAQKYVIPRKPLIFRDVTKSWPAFKLWTDEYLKEKYGEMEMRIEGKKEKSSGIPVGDMCLGRDRLKTFLSEYKKGANKYVVSELPTPMWKEVNILSSMSCGDFLKNFVEIDLWINSDIGKKGEGGNSILHKDAFNTVNCVINGTKDWRLVELKYNDLIYQSWEGPMDAGYGGFSLINPEKVDAEKFPDIGKIPRWQFAKINAGDCLYLPSQMWHQVKSRGRTNRAVAFLFSQFLGDKINASCEDKPKEIPLSDVDVHLQYPGTGLMTMGHLEIDDLRNVLKGLVDKKVGFVTKKKTFKTVYSAHMSGAMNKKIVREKSEKLYFHLLKEAKEVKENMNLEFFNNLSNVQLRPTYEWVFPNEPSNTYNHEYSSFLPEEITELIEELMEGNGGMMKKADFVALYTGQGGSHQFAENFWKILAGEDESTSDISKTLSLALEKYEYYRRESAERESSDDDVIITPQGHKSKPKSFRGGYDGSENTGNKRNPKTLKNEKDEL